MPSTEERIKKLINENLVVEGAAQDRHLNPESTLKDTGASSMAIVAFLIKLTQEFNLDVAPEDFAQIPNIGALIELIDGRSE